MDKILQKQLGARIKSLRKTRIGMTQDAFARKCAIDETYYAAIEQGRHNPTFLMLKKIASGLRVSLSELLKDL
ncbi:helix-turn-helix domain protein [Coriobacterium glomerans PW2]|uniref:Helix-turn-helix domain protein n=1 Tax=Coriobacterium glomerans (strain ATCC 49209 / DSM 20642 / JCM 10262 / PW2) TaxID=700015 RepID=F2N8A3_CORGP|nr:helix-turn-helix transcriptional regulator [Coriobacterium glomerans]AEB07286.1 helix-turn-helix domain protein [Coriobacterium glomerans PW2]